MVSPDAGAVVVLVTAIAPVSIWTAPVFGVGVSTLCPGECRTHTVGSVAAVTLLAGRVPVGGHRESSVRCVSGGPGLAMPMALLTGSTAWSVFLVVWGWMLVSHGMVPSIGNTAGLTSGLATVLSGHWAVPSSHGGVASGVSSAASTPSWGLVSFI